MVRQSLDLILSAVMLMTIAACTHDPRPQVTIPLVIYSPDFMAATADEIEQCKLSNPHLMQMLIDYASLRQAVREANKP